jgi:hypothetical protein
MTLEDNEIPAMPENISHIALIIDNEVVQLIGASERFYAMMMSNPIIKDVTGRTIAEGGTVTTGSIYNPETDTFILPE